MMTPIRNSSKLVMWTLILMITVFGCKSRKKAAEAAAAEKARMEQEAARKQQEQDELARKEAEEKARQEAGAKAKMIEESAPKAKLNQYFNAIATSGNMASANASINEALALFASEDTPVLIVISESGGQKDYDRPTTIKDYLNYLKDQKKNMNKISNLQFDSSGKITEVELMKY